MFIKSLKFVISRQYLGSGSKPLSRNDWFLVSFCYPFKVPKVLVLRTCTWKSTAASFSLCFDLPEASSEIGSIADTFCKDGSSSHQCGTKKMPGITRVADEGRCNLNRL